MTYERKYKLLFADDDLLQEPELVTCVEDSGFAVDCATTGLAAYKLIIANKYDAVVLDNMMGPGRDEEDSWSFEETGMALSTGLRVLQGMRGMQEPPPVWVLTALPDSEIELQEREFPFVVGYINKPCDLCELATCIYNYLEGKNAHS